MAPRGTTCPKCRGTGVRRVNSKRSYLACTRSGCNGVWGFQDVVRVPVLTKHEGARRKYLQNQIATRRRRQRLQPKSSGCSSTVLVLVGIVGGLILILSRPEPQ